MAAAARLLRLTTTLLPLLFVAEANASAQEEVIVRGTRVRETQTATDQKLTGDEIHDIPGTFGDPGRAIEAFPGVSTMASILPFYFVRGSTPANTGYFVDGVRVPFLSHAPPGSSFIAPGLIGGSNFYPGAAPARFGGVVGGTLSLDLKPPEDHLHGEAGIRLYDSYAMVETPFADGQGSALVAARYGYSQLLLSLLSDERQAYWDYNSRLSWKLSKDETVSVLLMGSHDFAGTEKEGTRFDTEFHRVDLRYDVTHENSTTRVAASFGSDVSGNGDGNVRDRILGLRTQTTYRISNNASLETGSSLTWDHYTTEVLSSNVGDPNILFAPRNDLDIGGYTQFNWKPIRRLEVDAGLRLDLYTSKRDDYPLRYNPSLTSLLPPPGEAALIGISPRLTTRFELTSNIAYISSFGVAHQPPSFLLPGLLESRLEDGSQTSVQTSQGIEAKLPQDFTLTSNLYRHEYLDLNDAGATCPKALLNIFDPTDPCYGKRVRGRSIGLEFMLRRTFIRKLTGWISYTLSRTTREAHALGETIIGYNPAGVQNVLSEWDRTHVINALAAYDFGRGWRAGARFEYNTGRPYSHTKLGVLVPPYNEDRLPAFWRIDARLEKRWRLGEHAYIAAVLEGFNVTLNAEALRCRSAQEPISIRLPARLLTNIPYDTCHIDYTENVGIPSVGVEGAF